MNSLDVMIKRSNIDVMNRPNMATKTVACMSVAPCGVYLFSIINVYLVIRAVELTC